MADRTNVADVRTFVSAMVQADAFGIPVAQVLRVQSSEMRVKRRQRAEEKAQQVPVKITIPLIFCILPCLFIAVMGPAVINIMDNFKDERARAPASSSLASPSGARVFGLVVLSAPALLVARRHRRARAGRYRGHLAGVQRRRGAPASTGDRRLACSRPALVGTVAALTIESSLAVLGALAIPPFTASLRRGPRGMLLALSAELIPLVVAERRSVRRDASTDQGAARSPGS